MVLGAAEMPSQRPQDLGPLQMKRYKRIYGYITLTKG